MDWIHIFSWRSFSAFLQLIFHFSEINPILRWKQGFRMNWNSFNSFNDNKQAASKASTGLDSNFGSDMLVVDSFYSEFRILSARYIKYFGVDAWRAFTKDTCKWQHISANILCSVSILVIMLWLLLLIFHCSRKSSKFVYI